MAEVGDSPAASFGALALLGAIGVAVWMERQKTLRAAGTPDEVALHKEALAAVDAARAQIHAARRAAETLSKHSVKFDVQAKLASAFTEKLPPEPKAVGSKDARPKTLFMVDGEERFPALKQVIDQLSGSKLGEDETGEPLSARSLLRQAIDAEGGLWSIEKALALLDQRGWTSDSDRPLNVVGNTLAAMARDDEIKRVGRGMYTSVVQPPSAQVEQEVTPGVFAREASPGVWVITGLSVGEEALDSDEAA